MHVYRNRDRPCPVAVVATAAAVVIIVSSVGGHHSHSGIATGTR